MRNEEERPEEESIIKDIRNLFRLKKETKAIKYRILRDIKNFFEHEKKKKIVINQKSKQFLE